MHAWMHGIMDACIQYRGECWQAFFFNNLQIVNAPIHASMHAPIHASMDAWMGACCVESMVYGQDAEKILLKSSKKKVRYSQLQLGFRLKLSSEVISLEREFRTQQRNSNFYRERLESRSGQ
jgi:hypothetical protein